MTFDQKLDSDNNLMPSQASAAKVYESLSSVIKFLSLCR